MRRYERLEVVMSAIEARKYWLCQWWNDSGVKEGGGLGKSTGSSRMDELLWEGKGGWWVKAGSD